MIEWSRFTPTQQRLLRILSDGRPHYKRELMTCLNDDMQPQKALRTYFSMMRKILRERGLDITAESRFPRGTVVHRLVKVFSSDE